MDDHVSRFSPLAYGVDHTELDCEYDHHRESLRTLGICPRIARRGTTHGSGLGKIRRVVERTHPAWLHQFKRLRTRWNAEPTFISD
jgi:hypothetical protein